MATKQSLFYDKLYFVCVAATFRLRVLIEMREGYCGIIQDQVEVQKKCID